MPNAFHRILDRFKTQRMCKKVAGADPSNLRYVPVHFKTQEMYNKAVRMDPWLLNSVSDLFVTEQQVET